MVCSHMLILQKKKKTKKQIKIKKIKYMIKKILIENFKTKIL